VELLSINVSLVREIEYNGKLISTGIFKQPISDAVFIGNTNIDGDEQVDLVNHGGEHKAVYAFSAHHYDYWRRALNQPSLSYGQFGENLTIENLDESQICIGDHLQVGEVILEVSQPRVPCFKLGLALNDKEMPQRFIKHGYTGVYFKVIKAGNIKTGDVVSTVYTHPAQLSVHKLFTAYFDKGFNNALDVMKQAANIDALSGEWMEKVMKRLNSPTQNIS
jgi:MOSC domain-containing protein YiiM